MTFESEEFVQVISTKAEVEPSRLKALLLLCIVVFCFVLEPLQPFLINA